MVIKSRTAVSMLALGVLGGGQFVAATAANAADCTSGYTCLYQNANFGGAERDFRNVSGYDVIFNLNGGLGFNDEMSSWINLRAHTSRWFFGIDGGGQSRCIKPNWEVSQVTGTENDQASSIELYHGLTTC